MNYHSFPALKKSRNSLVHMLLGTKWYHFISNDEVRCQTIQPLLTEIIQARRLTLFGHIARMDDNVDAKQNLTSLPSVYWKRPPGRPQMTWMKTVQNDLDSQGLSWTDTVDLAQNQPLWSCWQPVALCTCSGASRRRRRRYGRLTSSSLLTMNQVSTEPDTQLLDQY